MTGATDLARTARTGKRPADELLRLGLLACALLANLPPIFRQVGSMIWYHRYLGDYQVFWGITKVPLEHLYDHRVFAYPPTALLILVPFGRLPFWFSLIVWSAAGAGAMIIASRRTIGRKPLMIGFLTYAGIGVMLGGQISLFVGAMIIAALSTSRPRIRGLLFALAAVIKPQSLLAAPIALVAERNWRAIGWAVGGGLGLMLLSGLLFGADLWHRWLSELPQFHAYLVARGIDRLDIGIYGLARSLGLPGWTFLVGVPLGMTTSWLVFRAKTAMLDQYAAFAVSSVLMSPYTLYYDLAGLTFACVALLLDAKRSPLIWLAAALILSSWFASLGIVLLAVTLSLEALGCPTSRWAENDAPDQRTSPQESIEPSTVSLMTRVAS